MTLAEQVKAAIDSLKAENETLRARNNQLEKTLKAIYKRKTDEQHNHEIQKETRPISKKREKKTQK